MARYAFFKKTNSGRRLVATSSKSPSARKAIQDNKRAGVFSSGNFVAFRIVKDKKAYKIDGVPVSKKGIPFRH